MVGDEKNVETYKEVAKALGIKTVANTRRLWKKYEFPLKYRLGPNGWIRMTLNELERFRKLIYRGQRHKKQLKAA